MCPQTRTRARKNLFVQGASLVVCILFSYVNVVHGAIEAGQNFWKERQEAASKLSTGDELSMMGTGNKKDYTLLDQFPAIEPHVLLSPAHPQSPAFDYAYHSQSTLTHDLPIRLPLSYTNFKAAHIPRSWKPSDGLILYIQDIHMNQEAQKNIGSAIQELIDQDQVDLVALESAFDEIDISRFRTFEDQGAVKKVADYMLRENKITGPLHSALTSLKDIPAFVGVDDEEFYNAHVQAYKDSAPNIKALKKKLSKKQSSLEREKVQIFNRYLLDFDKQVQDYRSGELEIGRFVKLLESIVKKNSIAEHYPQVKTFLNALRMEETLDFKKVEQERSSLIKKLIFKLKKNQVSQLLNVSLAYRVGKIAHIDFYAYLKNLCKRERIELENFPEMAEYIRYVMVSDRIKAAKFLSELYDLEKSATKKLIHHLREHELVVDSRNLYLRSKLLDFALAPEEWKEYKAAGTRMWRNDHESIREDLRSFEIFFEHASFRDQAMTNNLLGVIEERKAKIVVLVTGGYHTDGMTQLLTSPLHHNPPPAVVTLAPKVTKIEGHKGTEYLSVFTQEKTPLGKLFAGDKLFIGQRFMTPGIRRRLAVLVLMIAGEFTRLAHLAWPAGGGYGIEEGRNGSIVMIGPEFPVSLRMLHHKDGTFSIEEEPVSFVYRTLLSFRVVGEIIKVIGMIIRTFLPATLMGGVVSFVGITLGITGHTPLGVFAIAFATLFFLSQLGIAPLPIPEFLRLQLPSGGLISGWKPGSSVSQNGAHMEIRLAVRAAVGAFRALSLDDLEGTGEKLTTFLGPISPEVQKIFQPLRGNRLAKAYALDPVEFKRVAVIEVRRQDGASTEEISAALAAETLNYKNLKTVLTKLGARPLFAIKLPRQNSHAFIRKAQERISTHLRKDQESTTLFIARSEAQKQALEIDFPGVSFVVVERMADLRSVLEANSRENIFTTRNFFFRSDDMASIFELYELYPKFFSDYNVFPLNFFLEVSPPLKRSLLLDLKRIAEHISQSA